MLNLLMMCLMLRPIATAESTILHALRSELRAIENPVTVIDIGTHNGAFLPRIKKALSEMGFKHIEIIGIDDFSFISNVEKEASKRNGKAETIFYEHHKAEFEKQGIQYLKADMNSAHAWLHRADFSFINAPFPVKIRDYVKAALMLTKHDGMIFLRFYRGDEWGADRKWLLEWLEKMNLKVVTHSLDLPEGSFWLSKETIVISRRAFPGLTEFEGTIFEDLVMGYFNRSELRKSA